MLPIAKGTLPIFCVVAACGGNIVGSLDKGQRAFGLSGDEAKQFCDELAALYGGYGASVGCDGGSARTSGPVNQATCLSQYMQVQPKFVSCPATVGQVEACLQWRLQTMCAPSIAPTPDACSVLSSPACSD
jgi:hypothetical protein